MSREQNIARFEAELAKVQRPGIDKLMSYIRSSDFYTAPASTKYHLSTPGGLLQHSLNVLDAMRDMMAKEYDGKNGNGTPKVKYHYTVAGKFVATITEESLVIMALLHDICKTYFYVPGTRNVKVKGKWKEVPTFTVNDRMPLGHGPKSAMLVKEYIKLNSDEMYAIWYHMGFSDDADKLTLGSAIQKFPIIWALHTADMMATNFMEDTDGNKPEFDAPEETSAPAPDDAPPPIEEMAPPPEEEPGFEEALPIPRG